MIPLQCICPICEKVVTCHVPKGDRYEIKSVAIDHKDHVLIIDYDNQGTIRAVNTLKVKRVPAEKTITCPKCNREIPVPESVSYYEEYAYVHDDHIVILYLIGGQSYMLDVIEKAPFREEPKRYNIIKRIVKKIGLKEFSYILTKAIIEGDKVVIVPKDAQKDIYDLLGRIDKLKIVAIMAGKFAPDPNINTEFMEKIISPLLELPERDAIDKLNNAIAIIFKFSNLLVRMIRSGLYSMARDFLNTISDENLRMIVIELAKYKVPSYQLRFVTS